MKRIVALILCGILMVFVCSCKKAETDKEKNETVSSAQNVESTEKAEGGMVAGAAVPPGITDKRVVYELVLVDIGPARLEIVKIVREIMKCDLKTAKYLVDDAERGPQVVKSFATIEEAKEAANMLEDNGAKTEIREV